MEMLTNDELEIVICALVQLLTKTVQEKKTIEKIIEKFEEAKVEVIC